jgi:hypothetical protein
VPPLPWRQPRYEPLLLVLVALAALTVLQVVNVQDHSRFCLTRELAHARLAIDDCIGNGIDRSRYGGHLYSNKAPGMSALALPAAEAVRLNPAAERERAYPSWRLWLVRVFASGLPFLAVAFLVGRVAESLEPGTGGVALVTIALGTLATPFAASGFDHLPAAAFGFAAFVLAWRRRPLAAGLAAGAMVLCEYESALVALVVGAYVVLQGRRALRDYLLGALPGAILLGAYDWAAFGAPWHNPLTYSDNQYRAVTHKGVVGIELPSLHATHLVLWGRGGLVVLSPVLVACVAGLVLLWRRGLRAEVAVCATVAAAYIGAACSYFDPYGGASPGSRFVIPALPFLFVGLGPALRRWRLPTLVLAVASVAASMAVTLTWSRYPVYVHGVWGAVVRAPIEGGSSELASHLSHSALGWIGLDAGRSAVIVCFFTLYAVGLGAVAAFRRAAAAS